MNQVSNLLSKQEPRPARDKLSFVGQINPSKCASHITRSLRSLVISTISPTDVYSSSNLNIAEAIGATLMPLRHKCVVCLAYSDSRHIEFEKPPQRKRAVERSPFTISLISAVPRS